MLSCYDRAILKAYLPFVNDAAIDSFVDCKLRIKRKDFIPLAEQVGETLVEHAKAAARVKHRVKDNWLKMYDKFGQILRVETVINAPREFQVRRCRERQGESKMVWCHMNK